MGKKKLTEKELRFNEDIKKVVLNILEKNKKPMIKSVYQMINQIYSKVNLEEFHIYQKIWKFLKIKKMNNLLYLLK